VTNRPLRLLKKGSDATSSARSLLFGAGEGRDNFIVVARGEQNGF
jgi:hypothetical protein